MSLKVSNKNRKKHLKQRIEKVEKDQSEFTRICTRYYVTFVLIVLVFFLII